MKNCVKLTSVILALLLLFSVSVLPVKAEDEKAEDKLPEPVQVDYENAFKGKKLYVAGLDGGYGTDGWKAVISKFEELTGAEVEAVFEKNIAEVVRPQIQSGSGPDVIYMSIGGEGALTDTMIKEKMIMPIEDVLARVVPGEDKMVCEKLIPGFTDTFYTNPYEDGLTYLAPINYSPCGLYYNKANFGEGKLALPETFDELFALKDKAGEKGAAVFTYPTAGYFDAFSFALLSEIGGPDFFNKLMNYDVEAWKSEEAGKYFELVGKLKDVLEPNTVSQANGELFTKNQQAVIDNKALFVPNGNWLPDEMKDAPKPDDFAWGFMPLPAYDKDGDRYSFTYFEQVFIPSEAAEPELAKAFIAFLYSDEAVNLFLEKSGAVMPVLGAEEHIEDELKKETFSIYANGAKASMGTFAAAPPVEGVSMSDALFNAIDSVMTGDKSVEEWKDGVVDAVTKLREAIEKEAE